MRAQERALSPFCSKTEDLVTEGLEPGDSTENIGDGWGVSFDKYIVTIGKLDLHLSTDESVEVEGDEAYVIDMTELPEGGLELWSFDQLREGRWEFNYRDTWCRRWLDST